MSSDYLLSGLGYNPDQSAKRLGDGFYEQKLVQQAVVARTGQRFIDGQTSDEALYKYLMDNAVASKSQLNLSLGVTLTSQQVAALTHDIVWLEEHEVNGEKVLVPVLYLANANNRLAANGALIQGSDVTLIAGKDLNNAGTLRASQNLEATAKNDLVSSGLVEAGNRLDLLATNNLTNKAGGIIAGRDVTVTATNGDVINERTVTSHDSSIGDYSHSRDFVDNAARIEAANNLVINAGRDVLNAGGMLKSGGNTTIDAARDVSITAVEERNSASRTDFLDSSLKQHGSTISSGGDLTVNAGRDLTVVASKIDVKGDVTMDAQGDLLFATAADEQHSYFKDKKETRQEDHVHQIGTSLDAGGKLTLKSGKDMTLIASDISAGKEAYLHADGDLQLLAAQNSDYTLYDMKKSGGWGSKKTQHDEVTQVTHIGTEIKSGGDLTLSSGGSQRYQVAKLSSDKNITLDSGGAIVFEGVKDLHDESHTKSDGDAFWTKSKGKGNTDETLRQTMMIAKGDITIKAVDGLHIDLKQIDQQTVSQSIDAMVKADPQLAWLKEAEARGDVDWKLVKEIHESFKYETSGLGPASQIIIAIIMAAVVGPAALTAFASLGTVGAAGLAAVATGAATNATTSFINNGGNLGAVFQDITSSDALKGYVISGVTAGATAGLFNDVLNTKLNPDTGKFITDLSTAEGVGRFGINQVLQGGTSALLGKALGQDVSGGDVLKTALFNTLAAASFNAVGDYTKDYADGSIQKIAIHAMVGGLLSEVSGGDFATGALAAGANEALIVDLNKLVAGNPDLLSMASQIVGVLAASTQGGDAGTLQTGAWVANNATQYNYLSHKELDNFEREASVCKVKGNCDEVQKKYRQLSVANDDALAAVCSSSPANCLQTYGYLAAERVETQKKIEALYANDLIPFEFKVDLNRYNMMNIAAMGQLIQADTALGLAGQGLSPEQAIWGATLAVAMAGAILAGKAVGPKATTSWQGSGPAPGVLGLEPGSVSSKAIQNYFPSTKNGSIEFVFDPKTNTFAVGKPINNLGGSPHQQLAETIKSDGSTLVGGMFRRGPNGEVITNEFSGHYWKNWTPEVRAKFEQTLKQYDLNVKHHPGM